MAKFARHCYLFGTPLTRSAQSGSCHFSHLLSSQWSGHGHLRLPADVRKRLLSISAATIDRLLRTEREKMNLSVSTTQLGNLLKQHIKVRKLADWNDVTPGFLEADLVAHCGGNPNGTFLNTLTLVDIATSWLECMPLLQKSAGDVSKRND